ncbi:lasso peptide biosynthesis protein [Halorarum salinum]|uniref:Lasso peptide biosynthesis protein n=2 Tax=Halorarum salinum TaxID=2743089 RepID=A0A7D5LD20_9EURY|nr:lasso peptide biosynthesis protein [Halobaculum salinum]
MGSGGGGGNGAAHETPAPDEHDSWRSVRHPAALGVLAATLAFASVFYHVLDVVGGAGLLIAELLVTVLLATWLAGFLRERTAVVLSLAALTAALVAYFYSVPESARALFTVSRVAADVLALVSGLSVLRLLNVGTWALLLAPVPTFLTWYLAARGRYVQASLVAALTTGFFVFTGDAGAAATVVCAAGVTVAVAVAGLAGAGRRGLLAQLDTVTVVVAAMVVLTSVVTVVPGSASDPVLPGAGNPSVESSLVTNGDRVTVLGSIELSPEVRFVVEANRSEYWRVGSYDRYTGEGWVRTGDASPYDERRLEDPPGESVPIRQRVTARSSLDAMPAAWKPVSVSGDPAAVTQVTGQDGLRPGTTLLENDTYVVTSEVPAASAGELRRAGTDYPDEVSARHTQLPGSTPERVDERTREVVDESGADNPYDAAVAVERYLESSKEYSLDVPPPSGDTADRFLFEMEEGYCVYYASTMAVMLRSQGIPARFVTGYTPGQRVAEEEWVVRGLDSHAWVEVYFPNHGWVRFDPTPSGPRESTETDRIEEARAEGAGNVDSDGSEDGSYETPTATPDGTGTEEGNGTDEPTTPGDAPGPDPEAPGGGAVPNSTPAGAGPVGPDGEGGSGDGGGDDGDGWPPDRGDVVVGAALLAGLVAGAHRTGVPGRAYRVAWLLYQPRRDANSDAVRAFRRLEHLGAVAYRARRPGETHREYLDALAAAEFDERVRVVGRAYERARYGPGTSDAEAADAVDATDALVRQYAPVFRRFGS